ncbi:MAG: exodeoxyribonuclease gamma subunit, partial [Solirubrobacteraceae bacterium]|nr:exodeoxyribonuclease gamma subunit [Solirubrobacteraceae bacterium]
IAAEAEGHTTPVRLADRSLRQTNGVLGVVGRLLEMAGERMTASQVLDLADREPLRRRFRLDDDALARAEEWVSASGTRWGLDAADRAPYKLDVVTSGTWRFGLDRLLAGVTMTEDDRLIAGVLPLDDVQSGSIDLAGRFTELVARLDAALARFVPQTVAEWAAAIGDAADALTAVAPTETWQRAELGRILADIAAEAEGHTTPVRLAEMRALIADRIQGRPTRANFRTGHLTICTLVPMRSVPHRVVCLLGLDDGAFPRKAPRDGDDLTLAEPHVGDRDARSEDRQQLLDALLAAQDKLIVTYTGRDERTNAIRPPAVPVGELLDAIERTVNVGRRDFVVGHPLQPFDPRNFRDGEVAPGHPWGFDRVTLRGARELITPRPAPAPFMPAPLPAPAPRPIAVEDLIAFVRHPVRAFLRQRLNVTVADFSQEVEDALPVELDALGSWGVAERILQARLQGVPFDAARRAELARGTLPPGALGAPTVEAARDMINAIAEHAAEVRDPLPDPGSVDIRLTLPDGRVIGGTVPGVSGDVLCTVTYSKIRAAQRLVAWVQMLCLSAAYPDRPFTAKTIGRKDARGNHGVIMSLPALGGAAAMGHLADLVDLYDRAMVEAPRLAQKTSAAYAEAAFRGGNPETAGARAWDTGFGAQFDNEDRDEEHVLIHGGEIGFADLLAEPVPPGETWGFPDASRFGCWSRRLWTPLLQAEAAA